MNVLDAIQQRRAVKHFDPNHQMPAEIERQLLEAVQYAPTSFNIQHWRFVIIRDPDQRHALKQAAWHQVQISDASLVVVICADIQAWQKQPERYWSHLPDQAIQHTLLQMLTDFYRDRPQTQRDEALRSVGIAAQTLMLAAQGLGYDSCPMIGFEADAVSQLIQLPEDHLIGMIVSIGKPLQSAFPRGRTLTYTDLVFNNHF
ncbi:MAG: nitroreductase family protein [Pseudomonadota bacterium]|nr:nitroreductase family protein [Pseudomonadota bacterium]